jgi:hypothetical protein
MRQQRMSVHEQIAIQCQLATLKKQVPVLSMSTFMMLAEQLKNMGKLTRPISPMSAFPVEGLVQNDAKRRS